MTVLWTRHEGRVPDGRSCAFIEDGTGRWELLLDGHLRGLFTGPDAIVNAIDAPPTIIELYPPEHLHGGGRQ